MVGEIGGEMSKLEAGRLKAGQRLADMQVARRTPAQHLLRAQPLEARERRVDHPLASAQFTLPFRLHDSTARSRPADDLVIGAQRVEHVHRVEKKMRRAQRVASQVENDRSLLAAWGGAE